MPDEIKAVTLLEQFNQWMQAQRLNPNKQFFDNQPLNVLDAFPMVEVTKAFLTERLWWWQRANQSQCHEVFRREGVPQWSLILLNIFKERLEHSAWMYEFRARYQERYTWDFGHPWVKCSCEQRRMLGCLWSQDDHAKAWLPPDKNDPLFPELSLRVNLRLNDGILIEQFLEAVERLRQRHGIARPGKGQGVRRREISWRPLQIMDKRHFKLGVVNESERSQLSKAKRAYEQTCAESGLNP